MAKWLVRGVLLCSLGCVSNLGSPDAPQRFSQGVQDQFDQQISAVRENASLSDEEKDREIARIERERDSFNSYNRSQ